MAMAHNSQLPAPFLSISQFVQLPDSELFTLMASWIFQGGISNAYDNLQNIQLQELQRLQRGLLNAKRTKNSQSHTAY